MVRYEYFENYNLLIVQLEGVVAMHDFIEILANINNEFKHGELDYILCDLRKSIFNFSAIKVIEILKYRAQHTNFGPKYRSVLLVDDVKQTTFSTLYSHFSQTQNLKLDIKVCVTITKASFMLGLKIFPAELERMLQSLNCTFKNPEKIRL